MTKVTETIEALASVPYLRALPLAERTALAHACRIRALRRGQTLFEEGAPADGLWLVVSGRVNLIKVSPRGREQVLHSEGPGATLGEVPVFDGGGYVASAIAADNSRVLFVPRQALIELCRRRPEVSIGVIAILARRVRGFAALIEDLALRDVTARLAGWLRDEARRAGDVDIVLAATREEIAARLGTVRELVSRSLSVLRACRLIDVRGSRVRIVDAAGLAAAARGRR
jgi:CRP/FNR family transcriptional regulator